MKNQVIPKATAKRLPLYYRYLKVLLDSGKTKVSSTELSEAVKVDSATIRRDFSYFGELGKRGYGYDVQSLLDFFAKTLSEDRLTNVVLIGVGNLGNALLKYGFHQSNNIRISAAFDIKEELVGRIVDGIPVYPMSDMAEQIKQQQIEIAIMTIPRPSLLWYGQDPVPAAGNWSFSTDSSGFWIGLPFPVPKSYQSNTSVRACVCTLSC